MRGPPSLQHGGYYCFVLLASERICSFGLRKWLGDLRSWGPSLWGLPCLGNLTSRYRRLVASLTGNLPVARAYVASYALLISTRNVGLIEIDWVRRIRSLRSMDPPFPTSFLQNFAALIARLGLTRQHRTKCTILLGCRKQSARSHHGSDTESRSVHEACLSR